MAAQAGRVVCPCQPTDEEELAMKTRAAVALEKAKPLTIMDVELDGPKAG